MKKEKINKKQRDFIKEVKRLQDINSPIQLVDTSKCFFVWAGLYEKRNKK